MRRPPPRTTLYHRCTTNAMTGPHSVSGTDATRATSPTSLLQRRVRHVTILRWTRPVAHAVVWVQHGCHTCQRAVTHLLPKPHAVVQLNGQHVAAMCTCRGRGELG